MRNGKDPSPPPLAENVKPWRRMTPDTCLVIVTAWLPLRVMLVWPVPAPCMTTALLTDTLDQEQLPAGTIIMSPVEAEFNAFCTSACEHDATLTVLACALISKSDANKIPVMIRFIDVAPPRDPRFIGGKTLTQQSSLSLHRPAAHIVPP